MIHFNKLLVSLCLLQSITSQNANDIPESRIIGGVKVREPWKYPFMISLQMYDKHRCGGTLITKNQIITAAHCSDSQDGWIAKYGIFDLNKKDGEESYQGAKVSSKPIVNIKRHPQYDSNTDDNDLAIWTVEGEGFANYNPSIKIISETMELDNKQATILGWGYTQEKGQEEAVRYLNMANINIFPQSKCKDLYKTMKKRVYDIKKHLCAGELTGAKDACQGDSGGPLLLIENEKISLIGITSYGIGCGRKERPGIYTNLAEYSDFIQENIKQLDNNTKPSSPSVKSDVTSSTSPLPKPTPNKTIKQQTSITNRFTPIKPNRPTFTNTVWFNNKPTFTNNIWFNNKQPVWTPIQDGWEYQRMPAVQVEPTYDYQYYQQPQPIYYYYY